MNETDQHQNEDYAENGVVDFLMNTLP